MSVDTTLRARAHRRAAMAPIRHALGRILAGWARWRDSRRAYRHLKGLEPRLLDDVGLTRCDVETLLSSPTGRNAE